MLGGHRGSLPTAPLPHPPLLATTHTNYLCLSQFVPFRDYVDRSGNQVLSMARLAKDVLAEIPEQLLSYMRTRDIQPRPPPPANPNPTPAPEQP